MKRITIPDFLHKTIIFVLFIFVFVSPLFYAPFNDYLVYTVNNQNMNGFMVIGFLWLIGSFGISLMITKFLFFALPIKLNTKQ